MSTFLFPNRVLIYLVISILLMFSACRKDEVEPDYDLANKALLEVMDEWYYYYQQMPEVDPSKFDSPYDLLAAVRYLPNDRWSYIEPWDDFFAYYNQSKYYGYGFGSAWYQGKLYITFTYRQTTMYENGVRRGWIIEAINGTRLQTGMSVSQLLGGNQAGASNRFTFIKPDGSVVEMTVAVQEININAVVHAEVIDRPQHKIGYLMLQNFTNPTIAELDSVFDIFLDENINELVLDMRYNGGGSSAVANYLSSLIGGDKVTEKVFTNYSYNDKQAATADTSLLFMNLPRKMNLDRLITIGTKNTASASELVINSLRPFMPVYIVGNDTYGKPMGSHVWNYGDTYAFVILSFKTKNANGEGDYFDGLPANIYAADDITRSFGDTEEASLREAIRLIETGVIAKSGPLDVSFTHEPQDRLTGLRAEIGAY